MCVRHYVYMCAYIFKAFLGRIMIETFVIHMFNLLHRQEHRSSEQGSAMWRLDGIRQHASAFLLFALT